MDPGIYPQGALYCHAASCDHHSGKTMSMYHDQADLVALRNSWKNN